MVLGQKYARLHLGTIGLEWGSVGKGTRFLQWRIFKASNNMNYVLGKRAIFQTANEKN